MMRLLVFLGNEKKYGFVLRGLDNEVLATGYGFKDEVEATQEAESVIGDEEYRIENYYRVDDDFHVEERMAVETDAKEMRSVEAGSTAL